MSRVFDGTNTFHLDAASTSISNPPITMFAWGKASGLGVAGQILNVGTSGSNVQRMGISLAATNVARFSDADAGTHDATSTSPVIVDTTSWHLYVGAAVDHTTSGRYSSMDAFYPGKGGAGGASTPTAPNCMRICGSPSGANNFNGLLAHVGFYSVTLSDAEVVTLWRFGPLAVQAANLVEYWPMTEGLSPEPSYGSAHTSMVLTGAVAFSTDNPSFAPISGRVGSFIGVMP